jgi:beta-glucanase (GH16 family)
MSKWGTYSGQPGGDPGGWWDPSHVRVRNGVLNLESYRDPALGGRWVSGGVSSAPALTQTYGKYAVRFRVDRGKGVAAVLLLWPTSEHWPPEIDFAEDGGETGARDHMAATLHYGHDNSQIQRIVHRDFSRWHVIGVEWTPGKLVYTLDGKPWAVVRNANVPAEPMELDLQTQTGTCGDVDEPCPDATTPSHVTMQVDWVVAWARSGSHRVE